MSVPSCGTNAPFSKADQAQAANELDILPPDSVIAEKIMPDWSRMRDENAACAAAK